MQTTSEAESSTITKLVEWIITTREPNLTGILVFKREQKVISSAKELRTHKPLFCAESTKFKPILVLHNDQCLLIPLQSLDESVHWNSVIA